MNSRTIKHAFFWLSGAGGDSLEQCPNWEQRKYVAYGATVLVPAIFAFIAASYAISTLTDNWGIIIPVSLAWSFIILTIDRALLATYRSYQGFNRKIGQFFLRFMVALLMGLTISHPLTLLLFKDTIHSVVEEEREAEIEQVRQVADVNKKAIEAKIDAVEADVATQRERWNETFNASFIVEDANASKTDPSSELDADMKAEMDARIEAETAPYREKIAAIEEEMTTMKADYEKVQGELDHWQREFEREVNGQRSGLVGLGPRARSIRDDQLEWRRSETERLANSMEFLTSQYNGLRDSVAQTEEKIKAEFVTLAEEKAAKEKEERARVAALKRQVQEEQADNFVDQQNAMRATISAEIDTRLEDLKRLQDEVAEVASDEKARIAAIRGESRQDLLTQTLALHKLFKAGEEGGHFALMAYLVLAGLFMLVDTIPIIVKFFSKPGPYDSMVDCEEVRYDREREAFLNSYDQYMSELSAGRLMYQTQDKPLAEALIHGVERSKVGKEFLEHLMELEKAFEERMEVERERVASAPDSREKAARTQVIEEMAETFYQDLRDRMAGFFEGKRPSSAQSFS